MLHCYKQDIFSFGRVAGKDLGEDCESGATWFSRSGAAGNGGEIRWRQLATHLLPHCCTNHRISSHFFPVESFPNAGVSESEVNKHDVVPAEKFNAKHLPPQVSASGIQILDASPFLPSCWRPSTTSSPAFSLQLRLAGRIRLGCVG